MTRKPSFNSSDRRTFLKATGGLAAAGLLAGCSGSSGGSGSGSGSGSGGSEETFPQDDISLVVPYGTSGGYNAYTRLVGKHMQKYVPDDVNIRVENVTGASGRVATNQVYNSEPDGYTAQIVNVQSFVRQQIIFNPDYDLTAMTWYPQVAENIRCIGVGTNTDVKTWEDYLTAVNNEELKFGATGPASGGSTIPFITGEVSGLYPAQKVLDNLVTFDGKTGTIKAIKSGDVQVMSGSYSSVLPFVESGDVRIVMMTTWADEAPESAGDAETFKTVDLNNGEKIADMLTARRVFAGPPEVPDDRANILRGYFKQSIEDEDLHAEAKEIERPIVFADSETAEKAVLNSFDQWNELSDLLKEITEA